MPRHSGWTVVERIVVGCVEALCYDVEVEVDHTYLVGEMGAVVHNCQICAPRDGLLYDLDHKPIGHSIPWGAGPGRLHPNDRCTSAPTLKTFREMGLDLPEIQLPGRLVRGEGIVPSNTTYADWLKRQPAAVQNNILGVRRAQAYRAGRAKFDDFHDDRGRWITLDRLKEIDGVAPTSTRQTSAPTMQWAENVISHRGDVAVPDEWYVHGRRAGKGDEDLSTGHVVQFTRRWETAEQYAGQNGKIFLAKPEDGAKTWDFSEGKNDKFEALERRAWKAFEGGERDWSDGLGSDSADRDDFREKLWELVAPENIVETAGLYDNDDFVSWLWENFGVDFVHLPSGGGVGLNVQALKKFGVRARG